MDREMRKRLARDAAGLPEPQRRPGTAFALAVEEAAAFLREHGRVPAAGADDRDEAKLGAWLERQRAAARDGALAAARAALLGEALGSGWSERA